MPPEQLEREIDEWAVERQRRNEEIIAQLRELNEQAFSEIEEDSP